jgi:hypothetical protein
VLATLAGEPVDLGERIFAGRRLLDRDRRCGLTLAGERAFQRDCRRYRACSRLLPQPPPHSLEADLPRMPSGALGENVA